MSVSKSEIKIGTINELGSNFEDALEAIEKDLYRHEGATIRLGQAAQAVQGLAKHVEKDLDEGKLAGLAELEVCEQLKLYVSRAAQILRNLSQKADNERMVTQGKLEGLGLVVQMTKKAMDTEVSKEEARKAAEAEGVDPLRRPPGAHPGQSLKQQRTVEAQKEAPKKKRTTKKRASRKKAPAAKEA